MHEIQSVQVHEINLELCQCPFHGVLMLLLERVPIRNLRTICETLAELAPKTQDPVALVAAVRIAMGRSIVQNIGGLRQELPVITLDPALEQVLQDSMVSGGDSSPGFEPGLADKVQTALADSTRRQEAAGEPAVLENWRRWSKIDPRGAVARLCWPVGMTSRR